MRSRPVHRAASLTGQCGFTLIELIVVLGVISLILAVAVPNLGQGSGKHLLAAAAHDMAMTMRLSRNRAVAESRSTRFIVSEGSYGLADAKHSEHVPQDISLMFVEGGRSGASHRGGAIEFYPDGSSTGGGAMLSAGTARYLIRVDWITGNVSIEIQSAKPHG